MHWIDMHCDTLSEIWKGHAQSLKKNGLCVDLDRLRQNGAEAQFFACFVNARDHAGEAGRPEKGADPSETGRGERTLPGREVWDLAYRDVLEMVRLASSAEDEQFCILRDLQESDHGIQQKKSPGPEEGLCTGGILTVEEGGVLNGQIERLEELYRKKVRLITLTWNYENCIGSPNSRDPDVMARGLKPFGMEVVERMNELGMIIDVSHLSDGGFWDCIRHSRAPIVASHSNARSLCTHPRNLSDEMLRALGEKGGIAGVNFYSAFLKEPSGKGGTSRAGMDDIVRHIRRMMDQAGEEAVALGTDFDGFEREALPEGISGVQHMERLWDALRRACITSGQIEKIASGNVKRVMREVWNARRSYK